MGSGANSANQTCDWLQHEGWKVTENKFMSSNFHSFGPLKSTWMASDLLTTLLCNKLSLLGTSI